MHVDEQDRVVSFLEKPKDPPGIPGKPDLALASMGIYVFDAAFLYDQLRRDAADPNSAHDFGNDIIPYLVQHGKARGAPLRQVLRQVQGRERRTTGATPARSTPISRPTWTSPGSSRRSTSTTSDWPIWTYAEITPPAKFVHDEDGRRGMAVSSLVSGGCIISGAACASSLLFTGVHVHSFAELDGCRGPARGRDRPRTPGSGAWSSTAACRSPRASSSARTPSSTRSASAAPSSGICLITQPMLDQLAAA